LSSQVDPVDTREVVRNVRIAILVGAAASLLAVVFVLGVRTDLNEMHAQVFLVAKLAFSLSVVILASHY
ncbi:NrsF family protein, partial [Klebsiella pneumoniae]